jgi:hypothetical protein
MSIDQFLLSADTTDLNYPEVRPTLDLNFARTKTLDPRITFTRASGGTYVGADGLIKYSGVNEARFDHDPVTGESLGLLIEEARTNLLTNSTQSSSWGFSDGSVEIVPSVISPDGTSSTVKFTENALFASGRRVVSQTLSTISGNFYTYSIFAKQPENSAQRYIVFLFWNSQFTSFLTVIFDPKAGRAINVTSGLTASVEKFPNGWWRFSASAQATATTSAPAQIRFTSSISDPFANYTGDGVSNLYVFGPQLEVGAFPTSYIPTQASTRTRAVDNAQITGRNFSEWYRPDEGSMFGIASRYPAVSSLTTTIFQVDDGTILNRILIGTGSVGLAGQTFAVVITDGTPRFSLNASGLNKNKISFAFKLGSYAASLNGLISSSNFQSMPMVQRALIGTNGVNYFNGTISRLTYFPKRLPNAQLQALTL